MESDWQLRPWARTFDLISSEYGWTDGQILELTLARLRQIRDVINVRRQEQLDQRLTYKEIEVRAITSAIHAAAGNRRGVSAAAAFSMRPKKIGLASENQVRSFVGAADGEGEFSQAQIAARAAELQAVSA